MRLHTPNRALVILTGLIVLSVGFYVSAQERSTTDNNIFLDSDQDSLTDAEEKTWGTDPSDRDTDHDGYSDGAEVKNGYDPKKPAPGDKLVSENPPEEPKVAGTETATPSPSDNLTQQVAQKITELTQKTQQEEGEDQGITMDELKATLDEALNPAATDITLPEIKKEDIDILEQNYGNLSKDAAEKRKKDDFSKYIAGMFYILSSNSPKPLTSAQDITSVAADATQKITQAISSQDASPLEPLQQSGEKILEQSKDIKVPEDLVDIHIKALEFATYAKDLKGNVALSKDDPIKDIANYSKIEAMAGSLMAFSTEVEQKFSEYGLTYDDAMAAALKSAGADPITDEELLKKLAE